MAEAVIVSIFEKIVASLVPHAIEKVGKLWGIKHELKALRDTVSTLEAVLDDAEGQYHQSSQVQVWLNNLKDAFYDAQDVLEEFIIEATRRELRGHNEMIKEVRTFFSSSNQLAFKLKMIYKVRAMRLRIEAIKADKGFHLDERPKREWRNREEHSYIHEGDIIGRDDDKNKIMKFLQDSNVKENVSVLPIVGIGGLGKTALAQCVFNDEMVCRHFDLKMWVCVSNDFDMTKIVKNIIACVKEKEPTEVALELLQRELRAAIDGKRYLLVLDDLWIAELATWDRLKTLLVGGDRGSKILITTRLPSVAEITGTAPPYHLGGLSEDVCIDMLMQMACRREEEIQDLDMLAIGKEIVSKCFGVPLVVRTVGSLLFFKKTKLEWLHFKDYELPDVSQREDSIISVLRLSYDHLPSHLKQCFAFCSLFPKDYEIEKQTLVDLWVAEGFIQPSNGSQHLEDIAHGYFMHLLWSNFFQDFEKDPYTNKETCKMHDLMHDLACSVVGTECYAAWVNNKSIDERTRHMSVGDLPISRLKACPLRTFLSTMPQQRSEADLCQLIRSFKRLRVLDLHDTYVEKVPRSICKLKYLTHLDLSHNNALKRLPNSITRLHNLQTLNLHNCGSLEELPRGIRKLVSLRNLDIDGCQKLGYVPRGLGQLSSLHRLTRFILPKDKTLAKNCCELGELNGLNNIRGSLSIENLDSVTNSVVESRAANLIGKHSLESLTLKWGDFDTDDAIIGNRDEALLDGLRPLSNLQKLRIEGYRGESFPRWMADSLASSLPNLVEVRFYKCGRCKRLPPLGQLPRLKSLDIRGLTELEYIRSDHSSMASFSSLLRLMIFDCEKLKAMPKTPHLEDLVLRNVNSALINMIYGLNKLKSLEIRNMEFLECLPEEYWKSLTSLESLCIRRCPRLTSLSSTLGTRHLSNFVDLDFLDSEELDLSKPESSGGKNNLDFQGGLQSLRSVYIFKLPKIASLPQWLLQVSNLEHLTIRFCSELDLCKDESGNNNLILDFHGGLHSLRSVDLIELPKLASLPQWLLQASNLERLAIVHCDNLKELPDQIEALQSLQRLEISRCPSLTSLPKGMRRLASLTHLSIKDWPGLEELDLCKDESGNNNLSLDSHGGLHHSLRSVDIDHLPKIESLPQWLLQLSNLEHLRIENCSNLKALPEQIEALQSLQELEIFDCPSLTSLPEGIRRLASLTHLIIRRCPELEERCKRDAGEDWYKIAHIPHIELG